MWQHEESAFFTIRLPMSSTNPAPDSLRHHIKQVRTSFLRLHKALLDSERSEYEQVHGRIRSPGEFLQLVMGDEWFNWLRPMSQFIVEIDGILDAKEPMTIAQAEELLETAHQLTRPDEDGTLPEQRYYHAIQRDPNVTILHVQVTELLATSQKS
jgi:hypothetical protein